MRTKSVLACVVLALACARGERDSVDTVAGTADLAAATAATTTAARSADLAKPLDQYTGDEFFSLVRGLQFAGGNERERRCRGCTGPDANLRTQVRVDGVSGADSIGAGNVPPFGVVVARGLNRGSRQEDRYGMRPGARFEYYLIVLPAAAAGGSPSWRIEELEIVGSRYTRRQLAVGRLVECNHPFQRGARSDFRSCEPGTQATPAMRGAFLQGGSGDDPWWYGCAMGCCVAEGGSDA